MPTGMDDDRQAILKLMARESEAFWNKDYKAWADCWVQAPYVCRTRLVVAWRSNNQAWMGRSERSDPASDCRKSETQSVGYRAVGKMSFFVLGKTWPG
jgi:hypothetical protein